MARQGLAVRPSLAISPQDCTRNDLRWSKIKFLGGHAPRPPMRARFARFNIICGTYIDIAGPIQICFLRPCNHMQLFIALTPSSSSILHSWWPRGKSDIVSFPADFLPSVGKSTSGNPLFPFRFKCAGMLVHYIILI